MNRMSKLYNILDGGKSCGEKIDKNSGNRSRGMVGYNFKCGQYKYHLKSDI